MAEKPSAPAPLKPHLTEAGKSRYAAREREACGPAQFMTRVRAVTKSYRYGDWRMLSGALEDCAAVCIAWAERVRQDKQRRFTPLDD